jgi:hypothetical protein
VPDTKNLEKLMGWVQACVVHPKYVTEATQSDAAKKYLDVAPDRIGDIILPSKTLSPAERLAVYAGMYPMRMRDALRVDYPVVKHFVGDEGWANLIDRYIEVHYSVHPNLNQLGRALPEYIRSQDDIKQRAFLSELATLEQNMVQVFDEEESPQASVEDLADLPPEKWAQAVFHPVKAFRLCTFNYPVNAILQAVKEERTPPPIKKAQTYTAVYRKNFTVWRMGLNRTQYRILKLLTEGKTVLEVLAKAAKGDSDVANLAQQLRGWFREWFEEGWFSRIEIREG